MVKRLLLVTCCLALSGTAAYGQVLEIEGRYWPASFTGTARVTGGHGEVPSDLNTVDLKGDLGLKDEHLKDWRLSLFTGPRSRRRVGYVKMDYTADQVVQRSILFEGQLYPVDTRVITRLNVEYWRYGWIWEFLGGQYSRVRFGTLLEAKRLSVDAGLSAPALVPPVAEKKSISQTLPTIGLVFDAYPSRALNLFAEVSGISAGNRGHALDGEAGVKVALATHLFLSAGYRYFDVEVNDDPDFAKFKNSGLFVGGALRF
jgi:hypothetical protein